MTQTSEIYTWVFSYRNDVHNAEDSYDSILDQEEDKEQIDGTSTTNKLLNMNFNDILDQEEGKEEIDGTSTTTHKLNIMNSWWDIYQHIIGIIIY